MSYKFNADNRQYLGEVNPGEQVKMEFDPENFKSNSQQQVIFIERGDGYINRLLEGSFNLLTDVLQEALSKNKKDAESTLTTDGLNLEMVHMMRTLGMFTGYLVNCQSWKDQEMHDFDRVELKARLVRVIQFLS